VAAANLLVLAGPAFAESADVTQPSQLEEVVVTGERGFGADTVQAGTFRNARVLDTPLTVNVISREVLDAQAAEGLYDALRNTGGVTRSQLSGGTYDNIAIRGILVENRGNYRLNGSLPVINLIEQPLENKARVEVLKGASALYYGFVPPSGVINMTTKRAGAAPTAEAAVRGDGHGTLIGHVDLGGRAFDGRLGARVNLAGGNVATGVDKVEGDRFLAAAAIDIQPMDRIRLGLDYEYITKDVVEPSAIALLPAVNGVITLPRIPDNTLNLGDSWMRYDAYAQNALARIDVELSSRWAAKLEVGRAQTVRNRAFSQFQTYSLATGEGVLRIFETTGQKYINRNVRLEVSGLVDTGPISHELTFGWTSNEREQNGRSRAAYDRAQNLYQPRSIARLQPPNPLTTNPSVITDKGAYLFDRMTLGPVQALVGVRWSDYESVSRTATYTAEEASPALALIYKPLASVSLYATWLEGLEEGGIAPANAVNANEVLPPAQSKQWELGAKAELFDDVIASVALFNITRPSAFRNSAGVFALDGETEYRGVEFAASGALTDRISLVASALWLDAEQVRAADPNIVGKRPENTPEWTGSLFAEWRTPFAEGLALNAGLFYVGERAVNPLNQAFVGGYVTTSVGARITREIAGRDTSFQVNVENALDEAYWNTAGNNLIGVGAPRTVKFSISRAL
jgi:iron complex outermembrane receptor protein